MSKNREGVLIHTYSPEFHSELLVLISQSHRLAKALKEHYSEFPLPTHRMTEVDRVAREFTLLEGRLRKAMAEMEEPPK